MKAQKVLTTKILICVLASIMLSLTLIPFLYKLTTKQTKPTYAAEEEHINNIEGLNRLVSNINNGNSYEGVTVYLDTSIDFKNGEWATYKDTSVAFKGTFDGQGHKISNINFKSAGFFCYVSGAVKNLWLENPKFTSGGGAFGFIAINAWKSTFESVRITGANLAPSQTTSEFLAVGGLVSYVSDTITINSCSIEFNNINVQTADVAHFGGLIGWANDNAAVTINRSYCFIPNSSLTINHGNKRLTFGGLFAGDASSNGHTVTLNCTSSFFCLDNDNLDGSSYYTSAGAIVGSVTNLTSSKCYYFSFQQFNSDCEEGKDISWKTTGISALTRDELISFYKDDLGWSLKDEDLYG